jgi:hypothetical protein
MLSGSARPEMLGRGAPTIADLATEAATLEDVQTLQVFCEFSSSLAETLLPPALHPTLPGMVGFTVQRVGASPWGPFAMAQTRIECRSGVRPRGFLIGAVVNNAAAAAALSSRWGFRVMPGEVRLRRFYDQVRAEVTIDGEEVLGVGLRDPEPLSTADVQYVANMNLASTPKGLRLVQVDPAFTVERAERGEPRVTAFAGDAWGVAELDPSYPVSASLTTGTVTLPRLRYVCRTDVWAFDGTERV